MQIINYKYEKQCFYSTICCICKMKRNDQFWRYLKQKTWYWYHIIQVLVFAASLQKFIYEPCLFVADEVVDNVTDGLLYLHFCSPASISQNFVKMILGNVQLHSCWKNVCSLSAVIPHFIMSSPTIVLSLIVRYSFAQFPPLTVGRTRNRPWVDNLATCANLLHL